MSDNPSPDTADERILPETDFASPSPSADEEYDSEEPPKFKLDLQKLHNCASTITPATCIKIRKLARGRYHQIFLLEFDSGPEIMVEITQVQHSRIARLARSEESLAKATSEIATMRYVGDQTLIPVARIFHQYLRPDNEIGAPFVPMERLPGQYLYKPWDNLFLDHKKDVLTQTASVPAQLAALHFDGIGILQDNGLSLHKRAKKKKFLRTLVIAPFRVIKMLIEHAAHLPSSQSYLAS